MAAAASAAVFVPSGNVRTSMSRPRSVAAATTRRTFGCRSVMAPEGTRAHDATVAELAFDELPLYLVQPTVEPARSAPGPSAAWGVVTPSIGGAGRASTLVMTRIVPLPPSIAVDSRLSWWRGRD